MQPTQRSPTDSTAVTGGGNQCEISCYAGTDFGPEFRGGANREGSVCLCDGLYDRALQIAPYFLVMVSCRV